MHQEEGEMSTMEVAQATGKWLFFFLNCTNVYLGYWQFYTTTDDDHWDKRCVVVWADSTGKFYYYYYSDFLGQASAKDLCIWFYLVSFDRIWPVSKQ